MLLQLEINNIALIEHICIDFEDGLNVLTGETGAGKSIIIDSINAVLGGRTTRDLIRTDCESASVTAVYNFYSQDIEKLFAENGITFEEDNTIIVSREMSVQGRNICRINSKVVPLSLLKNLGSYLIDIHGQHDNQSLLNVSKHIELLDIFGGEELAIHKEKYFSKLTNYKKLVSELDKFISKAKDRESRLDLLSYQINEIKVAKLKNGEEEELVSRRNILQSAEKIEMNLASAYSKLYEGDDTAMSAYDAVSQSVQELSSLSRIDERYQNISEKLNEAKYQMYDIIEEIRSEREAIDFEPGEIEEIEDRIAVINQLKRKYGKDIPEIKNYLSEAEEEWQKLSDYEASTQNLEKDIKENRTELEKLSRLISAIRQKSSRILEEGIVTHFKDLEMKHADFKISILQTSEFQPDGTDLVEFLVSTNLGEPLKPLVKIASGGEMSRIMLAIKAILAKIDNIPTMIFDEIDTGISGTAAARVGSKMAMISKQHQILCVTHTARIAACANHNILIEKNIHNGKTLTNVKRLTGEDLVMEIARLLDGEDFSETTRQHAREMLVR